MTLHRFKFTLGKYVADSRCGRVTYVIEHDGMGRYVLSLSFVDHGTLLSEEIAEATTVDELKSFARNHASQLGVRV